MSEDLEKNLEALLPRRWKSRWQRLSKRAKTAYKVGTAIGLSAASISGAYAYIAPSLEISPSIAASEFDAWGVEFAIKNVGRVTVVKSTLDCGISSANGGRFITTSSK